MLFFGRERRRVEFSLFMKVFWLLSYEEVPVDNCKLIINIEQRAHR